MHFLGVTAVAKGGVGRLRRRQPAATQPGSGLSLSLLLGGAASRPGLSLAPFWGLEHATDVVVVHVAAAFSGGRNHDNLKVAVFGCRKSRIGRERRQRPGGRECGPKQVGELYGLGLETERLNDPLIPIFRSDDNVVDARRNFDSVVVVAVIANRFYPETQYRLA